MKSQWVVRYSRKLLNLRNCYLKEKIYSFVKSIRYDIKYIMKYRGLEMFGVNREVGLSEVVALVLGFPIHEREPSSVCLQFYRPEENLIFFRDKAAVTLNSNIRRKTLSEFMDLCSCDQLQSKLV